LAKRLGYLNASGFAEGDSKLEETGKVLGSLIRSMKSKADRL
jgi:hypothetical protein